MLETYSAIYSALPGIWMIHAQNILKVVIDGCRVVFTLFLDVEMILKPKPLFGGIRGNSRWNF